jgi:hypothetical protein
LDEGHKEDLGACEGSSTPSPTRDTKEQMVVVSEEEEQEATRMALELDKLDHPLVDLGHNV